MQPSALLRGVVLLAGLAGAGLPAACGGDSDSNADGGPGDDPDAGDPNALDCDGRSGTRIKQVVREHSDGSRQVLRLFDSELMETCSYGLAADSSLRCIPIADGSPFAAGTVMYTTPGCAAADRIAQLAAAIGDPAPTHMQQVVSGGSSDGCAPVTYNYQLGNPVVLAPETTIYRKDADQCVGVTAGSNPYYEIAAEVGPEDLVAGSESWVGEGRVQTRRLEGDDGSRTCDGVSFRDLELETSCQLAYGEDNSIECLPSPLAITGYFTAIDCATGVSLMVVPGQCDTGARYGFEPALAACSYRQRVRALGAEYADPYFEMTGSCMEVNGGNNTAYRVGPAIAGTSFSSFAHTFIADGGDRLERGDLQNADGLRLRSPDAFGEQWRDTMLDTPCTFETATDEMVRCLPSGSAQTPIATVVSLFSDTGCATPVQVGQVDPTCAANAADPTYARDGLHVYPVTGPAPATYRMEAACVQVTDMDLYAIGAEVTADMFVSGEETTE